MSFTDDSEQNFSVSCCVARQMTVIENVQNALDDMGAVCKVVVHLDSRVSDVILQEALALMVKLLFGGNSQVQVSYTCGRNCIQYPLDVLVCACNAVDNDRLQQ